ncbi:di-heme oxidoredictase family protein [Leptospira sp. 'Mane']|uniref:di-heme oxidoreductase family protein n=1 Tax=Leptospira sp. 'Mane' TaxID=3387407 RepID=UPI00398B53DA
MVRFLIQIILLIQTSLLTGACSNSLEPKEKKIQTVEWAMLAYYLNNTNQDDPREAYSGGDTTTFDSTVNAFDLIANNVDDITRLVRFDNGNANFNLNWVPVGSTALQGLGPTFNSTSCNGCHVRDGRGKPPDDGTNLTTMLIRIGKAGEIHPITGGNVGLDNFGTQLNPRGIIDNNGNTIPGEGSVHITYQKIAGTFPDGEIYSLRKPTYTITWNTAGLGVAAPANFDLSPRTAPMIPGLGLLEAIPEDKLKEWADPNDSNGDGISGKINLVWDRESSSAKVGRFGWKAGQPNLRQQNAEAFLGDIGLTNPLLPTNDCPGAQTDCAASPVLSELEVSEIRLGLVSFYTGLVGVPGRRGWKLDSVKKGKASFVAIGCTDCHKPYVVTGNHSNSEIANQDIRPYTDLLLHDMGEDLADNRGEFLADGREWRTPPLWAIGLIKQVNQHEFFLHDGRARGYQEAILWHGGEAETAKQRFKQLTKEDRANIILFLKSL